MHAKIFSATTIGIDAHLVEVEADLTVGLVNFYIVGLPDTAIKESSKRIQSALTNCGFRFPAKRIVVNLAPADLKKEGTVFDLPIAIGIICAAENLVIAQDFLDTTLFLGELSLDGSIRSIKGALAIACDAKRLGKKRIILPETNAHEAALIDGLEIIGINHITQLVAFLRGELTIEPTKSSWETYLKEQSDATLDFAQVKGQHQAKRALQICAAGGHNVLFIGPPGSGKTMLAKRLQSIMPPLTFEEVLDTSKIYSICGKLGNQPLITKRPFRDPHHTISQPGLVGGGTFPQPGEISLAHHGILFLDELTEFKRTTLEAMRQPLESGTVCIARVNQTVTFPASFILVAALNPCPCGFWADKSNRCTCSSLAVEKYLEKLSGPLLDRIDLHVHVQAVDYATVTAPTSHEQSSAFMKEMVNKARAIQQIRFNSSVRFNSSMTTDDITNYCQLSAPAEELIKKAFDRLGLSMRGYHKIIKIARTIADLAGSAMIDTPHIQEALMYRSLDKKIGKT